MESWKEGLRQRIKSSSEPLAMARDLRFYHRIGIAGCFIFGSYFTTDFLNTVVNEINSPSMQNLKDTPADLLTLSVLALLVRSFYKRHQFLNSQVNLLQQVPS